MYSINRILRHSMLGQSEDKLTFVVGKDINNHIFFLPYVNRVRKKRNSKNLVFFGVLRIKG